MPSKNDIAEMVINQMLKGPNNNTIVITKEQRRKVFEQYEEKIKWIINQIPNCSPALGAVLTKAAIRYGEEIVQTFCQTLRTQNFNGPDDPSYHLWKYMTENKKPTKITYKKSIYAIKSYIEGKKITSLRQSEADILKWDGEKFVE